MRRDGLFDTPFRTQPVIPWPVTARSPVTCPVCAGRGTVAHDFYPDRGFVPKGERPKCRTCGGRGIV